MERKRGREEAASSGNKLVDGATKKMRNGLSQFQLDASMRAEKKQLVPRKKIRMRMLYYEKPGLDAVLYIYKAKFQRNETIIKDLVE
ncbi:hypothetical protein EV1_012837 [Malus domestica]